MTDNDCVPKHHAVHKVRIGCALMARRIRVPVFLKKQYVPAITLVDSVTIYQQINRRIKYVVASCGTFRYPHCKLLQD
jgi:inner membrane protein involved in colicin E2 resistance